MACIRRASFCSWNWNRRQTSTMHGRSWHCMCVTLPSSPPPLSSGMVNINGGNDSLLMTTLLHPKVLPSKVLYDTTKMIELQERTQLALRNASETTATALKLIDTLQRLGIGYHFEEDITRLLERFLDARNLLDDEYLFTTALYFRLLRQKGYHISSNVFQKFVGKSGKFKESLGTDIHGMLSLYEASYLGTMGEDVLTHAMEFTETKLRQSIPLMGPQLGRNYFHALELPRHLRMERLESRRFIEECGRESDQGPHLVELAMLDYNKVQSLHQAELAEILRWWKQLGLVEKLSFGCDRPLECHLWTVGLLPEPKYSESRIELAKTIAILLVLDDIFDTYGSLDELVLFTEAIQRWDLGAMEQLPRYMMICYMALYNTTNEIGYKVLKELGLNVVPHLKRTAESYGFGMIWALLRMSKKGGDVASSIDCFKREKNLPSEAEARKQVKQLIRSLWKELNGELMDPKKLPLPLIKSALNMSRSAQVIYQHGDNNCFSRVDDCVQSLFFTPISF